ncbi:HTH_Tnp_Tc3_2 domain-containing protein [Trichonephila clavipes]|nr:HTH_Tnp_Tc3_2 domain-containing protein [Trichonephila clavipes]
MNKILKTPNYPIVLSKEFIEVDNDNVCTASIMVDKNILEFSQSSKNIIDANSDEMNSVAHVPTSSEMRNDMKNIQCHQENHKDDFGLRSRRPLRRLPLPHIIGSVDWILPTSATWSVTDWRRVIFSDESRFSLSADDHAHVSGGAPASGPIRHLLEPSNFTRCDSVGSNFWGFIRHLYVDDILTPIVLPMLSSHPGAIYQQDNARPHTARLSQQCLQGYDVLPWPARSPDLSLIEHVWDAGKATAAVPRYRRINCADAKTWQDLGHKVILIESCQAEFRLVYARGGFTTY